MWDAFAADWARAMQAKSGAGLALVTGRIVSPTALVRIAAAGPIWVFVMFLLMGADCFTRERQPETLTRFRTASAGQRGDNPL